MLCITIRCKYLLTIMPEQFYKKIILFLFYSTDVLPACMFVYYMYSMPAETGRDYWISWN